MEHEASGGLGTEIPDLFAKTEDILSDCRGVVDLRDSHDHPYRRVPRKLKNHLAALDCSAVSQTTATRY